MVITHTHPHTPGLGFTYQTGDISLEKTANGTGLNKRIVKREGKKKEDLEVFCHHGNCPAVIV